MLVRNYSSIHLMKRFVHNVSHSPRTGGCCWPNAAEVVVLRVATFLDRMMRGTDKKEEDCRPSVLPFSDRVENVNDRVWPHAHDMEVGRKGQRGVVSGCTGRLECKESHVFISDRRRISH